MRDTIKKHIDFKTRDLDPVFKCDFFIARAKPAVIQSSPRFGIIATKKTLKHAVNRNRAKRLIRVWVRFCESDLNSNTDYIFIIRRGILNAKMPDGISAMHRAIQSLNSEK